MSKFLTNEDIPSLSTVKNPSLESQQFPCKATYFHGFYKLSQLCDIGISSVSQQNVLNPRLSRLRTKILSKWSY